MTLPNGYTTFTTFNYDFAIADAFGVAAVQDTYNRAFKEWKNDIKYITELVIILNYGIWKHYQSNEELALLYDKLWQECQDYVYENFSDDDISYFYNITN